MKKMLSFLLTAALLLTMIAVPVSAIGEATAGYAETTLGNGRYYKFTFTEDDIYNYVVSGSDSEEGVGQATYKNNTFYPMWTNKEAQSVTAGYKQVTDVDTGNKYDTLQITAGALNSQVLFTPLTKEGKPFELTPGKKYRFSITYFNPVSSCWSQMFVSAGGSNNKTYNKYVDGYSVENTAGTVTETYMPSQRPATSKDGMGVVGGAAWSINLKDGTYGVAAKNYTCLHNSGIVLDSCAHGQKNLSVYKTDTKYVAPLAEEKFVYNDVNKSFSAELATYTKSGDTYTATGETTTVNNYLTLELAGGDANYYADKGCAIYGNVTAEEVTQTAPNVWQIESIEVWDVGIEAEVTYHYNNGTADETVTGEDVGAGVGEVYTIDRMPTNIPEGKYFAGWYTDAACTVSAGEKTVVPADGFLDLYAKYGDYVKSVTFDYKNANIKNVCNYGYMKDGVYYCSLNEIVWGEKTYTDNGVVLGKGDYNAAYTFNPDKTNGLDARTDSHVAAGKPYVAGVDNVGSTTFKDMAVGETASIGWTERANLIIKDASGNAFIAKPNTEYGVTVKYTVTDAAMGDATLSLIAGRPFSLSQNGSGSYDASGYASVASNKTVSIRENGAAEATYSINTGDMTDAVPVLSLHMQFKGFKAKKLAEANGVESYTLDDGRTVYPFEIIGKSSIVIEEITVAEVDSSVTIINGTNQTVIKGYDGQKIVYPELSTTKDGTPIYSLSANEYIPAPTEFTGEAVTVYVIYNTLNGFEDYKQTNWTVDSNFVKVSDEKPYEGDYSIKFINNIDARYNLLVTEPADWATKWTSYYTYDAENGYVKLAAEAAPEFATDTYYKYRGPFEREHSIELWGLKAGESYKITYKYFVAQGTETGIRVEPYTAPSYNIWDNGNYTVYTDSFVTIPASDADGEWHDGVIYLTVGDKPQNSLYIRLGAVNADNYASAYFDNFNYEKVDTATFNVLVDNAVVEGDGVYNKNTKVFTAYGKGAAISAPVVSTESGAAINTWYTDEACTKEATSIVAGGVYYGTIEYVEFVDLAGNRTKGYYNDGDVIVYPELAKDRNYDSFWSLKEDSYEAVPENFDGTITVYAVKTNVIGFENYASAQYVSGSVNVAVSDEMPYNGKNSLKYTDVDFKPIKSEPADWATNWTIYYTYDAENGFVNISGDEAPAFEEGKYYSNRNEMTEHAIVLNRLGARGTTYKISFKYYVPETLKSTIKIVPFTNNTNIWTPYNKDTGAGKITYDYFSISQSVETGKWIDGEIYFTSNAIDSCNYLYLMIQNGAQASGDVVYFDEFAITEAQVVYFEVPEGYAAEIYNGVLKDGVITAYFDKDAKITAPIITDADGNPVEKWVDAEGKGVTEFVSGGVYSPAPAFEYGDCNGDGEIDATDLAILKLKLAGSAEVAAGADCNGDGKIDATDLAILKLYLAGSATLGPAN